MIFQFVLSVYALALCGSFAMVDRLANTDVNARRIAFIEQCFGSSGQPLGGLNRVLVGEGILTKMCRKKPKPRQFFLFSDVLVYGNILIDKKKYNKQHILPLDSIQLKSIDDTEDGLNHGWQIISPSKSFSVYAATAVEKNDWMTHINQCIHTLRTRKGNSVDNSETSPVWVPDVEANVCMHCRKSEFSVLNRRHHCRSCGIVCCSSCSDKRWLLPHQSQKPLRVCLTCFNKLTIQALERTPLGVSSSVPSVEDFSQGKFSEPPTFYSP